MYSNLNGKDSGRILLALLEGPVSFSFNYIIHQVWYYYIYSLITCLSLNNNNNFPTENDKNELRWVGRFRVPVWSMSDRYNCWRLIHRHWHKWMRWWWMTWVNWKWQLDEKPGQEARELSDVCAHRPWWKWLVKEERLEWNDERRGHEEQDNQGEWQNIDAVKAGEDV